MDTATTSSHVELVGRLGAHVQTRELPSGDQLTTFTVIVDRPAREQHGTTKVDAIACVARSAKVRDQLARMEPGTVVSIDGVLRRRFWRTGSSSGAVGSSTEVQVRSLRRSR